MPYLIITDQQNFLQIYQWEDTLRNKRRFLPCYSSKISCSYLSFDVLPVMSPLIWLIESSPVTARIRPTPPSFSLRNILYVCQMKCPDRCPGEPVRALVERGTGETEKLISLYTVRNIPKFRDRANWSPDTFQPMRRRVSVYQQTNQNIALVLKNFQNNGRSRRTK